MYFFLCKDVHVGIYNDEAIVLNTVKNSYHVLGQNLTQELLRILSTPLSSILSSDDLSNCKMRQNLIEQGIVSSYPSTIPYDLTKIQVKRSRGLPSDAWDKTKQYLDEYENKPSILICLKLLYLYCYIIFIIKIFGPSRLLGQLTNQKQKNLTNNPLSTEFVSHLNYNFRIILRIIPYQCLYRCLIFAFYFAENKIDCDIVIGVQTHPFFAHSWIEVDQVPILDSIVFKNCFVEMLRV